MKKKVIINKRIMNIKLVIKVFGKKYIPSRYEKNKNSDGTYTVIIDDVNRLWIYNDRNARSIEKKSLRGCATISLNNHDDGIILPTKFLLSSEIFYTPINFPSKEEKGDA